MIRTDSQSRGQGGREGDKRFGRGTLVPFTRALFLTSTLCLATFAGATEKPTDTPVATPPVHPVASSPAPAPVRENPLNGALRFLGLPIIPTAMPAEAKAAAPKSSPVDVALKYLGVRYRFGGMSEKGVDCSGLVKLVFSEMGIRVPAQSTNQYAMGEEVPRERLLPGDLIFFKDTYRKGISHVGIYIGGSRFVHASRKGVAIASLDSAYFAKRYAGGRRVPQTPPPAAAPTGSAMATSQVAPVAAGAMLE